MNNSDIPLLILLVAALLMAMFLALSEAALLRVNEIRVRSLADGGDKRAARLTALLKKLPAVLNLILLLALLAQIGAATITGVLVQRWFGNLGVTIASFLLTIVLFIYCEAIPKTFAVRNAERSALFISAPISVLERVFRPLVTLLVWIADLQMPGKGITTTPTVTEDELRLLAYRAAHEGEITEDDLELIERAFRFGDRRTDDIMVPRPDIVAVESSATIEEALDTALGAGHSRLPMYTDTLEHVTGVVRLQDLTEARERGEVDLAGVALPPLIVPESKKITSLLAEMQDQQIHLAIVVDEYGVTVGLVTIEDIAEELLGSISHEARSSRLEKVAENCWSAPGSMPVEDLADLDIIIPEGDWNTIAGMMVGKAGRLLSPGEQVEIDGFTLTVQSVRRRRITRVSIERTHEPQPSK
ncbi:MAG: hemolysin family protein [Arenicellales bacterium]|nr:hemolysin family protein [Arenicellales bacterium]